MRDDKSQGKWAFGRSWIIANFLSWGTSSFVAMFAGWIIWQFYQQPGGQGLSFLTDESKRLLIAEVIYGLCWGPSLERLSNSIFADVSI